MKLDILSLSMDEIEKLLLEIGEPSYRSQQLFHWIYKKLIFDFSKMTNLSQNLRNKLKDIFYVHIPDVVKIIEEENTIKFLLRLKDNELIEFVLIIHKDKRKTVCVSTQVGCAFQCKFCATGLMGFKRNLTSGEIVSQVLLAKKFLNEKGENITNVVYMGMGEPLSNYSNVIKSIKILNSKFGLNIGARHISLSTVGLVPQIYKLSEEKIPITLSISLHAPENNLRDMLIPINKKYPLEMLLPAIWHYFEKTKRRITFEYILLEGINDTLYMAEKLVNLLKGRPIHVNLIPYNFVEGLPWKRPSILRIRAFENYLRKNNINVTLRISHGYKIMAGCGQLAIRR
jgi:23S rRNA (adenine2503-C2)-methyltransferase